MVWKIKLSCEMEAETKEKANEIREDQIGYIIMLVSTEEGLVSAKIETVLREEGKDKFEDKGYYYRSGGNEIR